MQLNTLKDTLFDTISRQTEKWTGVVTGAPETVRIVVAATNNEQWGPTGPQMRQISDLTFHHQECTLAMQTIWDRLSIDSSSGANWRIIYKTLLLLDYIIKNGAERVINDARQTSYQIRALTTVNHVDPTGVDRGISIRERAKQIVDLLSDTNRLREERKKAKQNRDKYNAAYGSESPEFHRRNFSNYRGEWDETEFSRKIRDNTSGYIDDEDFGNNKNTQDFGDFEDVKPALPQTPVPPSSGAATETANWDPFGTSTTGKPSIPATADDWDDFNPRPIQSNLNWATATSPSISATSPSISAIPPVTATNFQNTFPSSSDTLGAPTIQTIFGTPTPLTTPTNPTTVPVSTGLGGVETLTVTPQKTAQPNLLRAASSPAKSSDPWAHSQLFDLSLSEKPGSGPSPNKSIATSGKTLGSTVGSGWGTPSSNFVTPTVYTSTGTYPTGFVPSVLYNGGVTQVATSVPYTGSQWGF